MSMREKIRRTDRLLKESWDEWRIAWRLKKMERINRGQDNKDGERTDRKMLRCWTYDINRQTINLNIDGENDLAEEGEKRCLRNTPNDPKYSRDASDSKW